MLDTLRACPAARAVTLSEEFQNDINWFDAYFLSTNGVYMNDDRVPIPLYIYACTMGAGVICLQGTYHTKISTQVINAAHPICLLEVLNAVAALQTWAPKHQGQFIHLYTYTDSATAAIIFQAGKGRDSFIRACALLIK